MPQRKLGVSWLANLRPLSIFLGILSDKAFFIAAAVTRAMAVGIDSPSFALLTLGFGVLATGIGAVVAARHAGHRFVFHGLAVGVAALAISLGRFAVNSLSSLPNAGAAHPLWWELTGWTGAVLAGFAGGWVAGRGAAVDPPAPQTSVVIFGHLGCRNRSCFWESGNLRFPQRSGAATVLAPVSGFRGPRRLQMCRWRSRAR